MSNKILVVAAHPDDEVLGCGGTIRRLANEGSDIYIAVLSAGVASRYGRGVVPDPKEIQAMIDVFKAVSLKLGAKDVSVADYPDNRFDSVSVLDVTKTIEACVDRWKPSVIFTHHCSDLNIDHHVTSRAVMTATRPVKGVSVRDIYSFEVPSSTEWTFGQIQPTFSPNVFYDITDTLQEKIDAMMLYESELREFPHPRSSKAIASIAQRWGSAVGVPAAESFQLIRSIV
jgi:LmbE family N-acetylglucosaminyl deacetylase